MQLAEPGANQILQEAERQCAIASQQWGVTFNSPSWAQDAQGVYVILYARRDRGKYLSVRVSDEDLEDYPEEPAVQAQIREDLRRGAEQVAQLAVQRSDDWLARRP